MCKWNITQWVHREATWSRKSIHLSSFVPVTYKQGLVKPHFYRARNTCRADQVEKEDEYARETLRVNGCSDKFVVIHKWELTEVAPVDLDENKWAITPLSFKGDRLLNRISQKPRVCPKTHWLIGWTEKFECNQGAESEQKSTKVPNPNVTHIICQFNCSCGDINKQNALVPRSTDGEACLKVVSETEDPSFTWTQNEHKKPGLFGRETSYDLRTSYWPRPSVFNYSTEP